MSEKSTMNSVDAELTDLFEQAFRLTDDARGLDHLEKVVSAFANIPYENLTKIIRASRESNAEDRLRQPAEVLRDYIDRGTGGTCFSLTWCLKAILSAYGYTCFFRMADLGSRRYNHCALVVQYNERLFLLDPGYLITRPLPIPESGSVIHDTRLHPVLIEKQQITDGLSVSTMEPTGIKHRYYLHGKNCDPDDFKAFWIDSFSWNMMNSLLITRVIPDGRFYLHDRHVRWFDRKGHRSLKVNEAFDEAVSRYAGIDRTIVQEARKILSAFKRNLAKG